MSGRSWRIGAGTTTKTDPIEESAKYPRFCCITQVAHPARHPASRRKTLASDEVTLGSGATRTDSPSERGHIGGEVTNASISSPSLAKKGIGSAINANGRPDPDRLCQAFAQGVSEPAPEVNLDGVLCCHLLVYGVTEPGTIRQLQQTVADLLRRIHEL